MSMDSAKYSFVTRRQVRPPTSARRDNVVSRNGNIGTASIPSNRNRNLRPSTSQQTGSVKRTNATRHLNCHKSVQTTPSFVNSDTWHSNRRRSVQTAPSCVHNDITKDEKQNFKKLFAALAVFKRTNIQEIKQAIQLIQTMQAEVSEKRSEIPRLKKYIGFVKVDTKSLQEELWRKDMQLTQLNQGRCWNVEDEQLEMTQHDLQLKYDQMKYESQVMSKDKTNLENEIEILRNTLLKTEREFSQQKSDICFLQKHIESLNQEAWSLKEQLYENNMQIQNQGSMEHKRMELKHKDMQQKYDKIKYESKATVMEQSKLENEIVTLRSTLEKTEKEFLHKTNEMSRLKKQVELMDKESKYLKAQLQERDKQLPNKNQGKYCNVDQKQFEKMENDFQRKLNKMNAECQEMVKAKAKLENEVDTILIKLKKTEQELSEKTSEIYGLKARVKSTEDESKSLKAQLQEKDMLLLKQNQGRNWNWEFEQLDIRHKDLQGKFDKINDEYRAMEMDKCTSENINEKLRSTLRKTEHELSKQTSEISELKKLNESLNQESESLKTQLLEKDMFLLKQNQRINRIAEYEQLELRYKDLQQEFDKIKYESQAMTNDKAKLENENETLRSKLQKTEQDLSQQRVEITRIKKHAESVVEKSESLHAQLKEKERQQLQQNQGRNLNVEYEQLETRHTELQRKFDKTEYEARALMADKKRLENENEQLRSIKRKTEQDFAQQSGEMIRLKKHVESAVEHSESLKAQLKEKERQQLKQNQGRNLNVEYEQLATRHTDLQRKFDKIEDEAKALMADKTRFENENEQLRSMLQKTEQEVSQQNGEMTRLKKHVESMVEKSESLKAQLQEKERQQLKQNQGRNLNVEYEQLVTRHNDLQRKFDKIEDEAKALMADKTRFENENEQLRSMLQKTEQEVSQQNGEMTRLKKHVESMVEKSESLKAQLQEKERQQLKQNQGRNLNVEYEQLVTRHNDLQRKFDQIEDEAKALMADKTKIENENKKLSSVLKKTEQESFEQKNEISKLKKRGENMDRELESFKAHLQQKERQLQEQILATTKANAEKDDALTRLSRLMGQQMSEGNPNITDLSDQNRPSKLGERYSELYDNEWTNAFEVLTDNFGKNDKEAIDVLRTILFESYTRALDFSISQLKEAESKLSGSTKGVGNECKRLLKEARKHINIKDADSVLENVLEVILSKVVDRSQKRETTLRIYTKECFLLCWYMSIQDPPVVLVEVPTKGSRFDTNIYKHYINSGDTVDYVVWPALFLHKGGPLLTKGVAQPLVRSRSE
ncbi:hypothetical protein ACJMK2_030593 [Sinanodonta woodiana]|uniref:Mitochondria-eating protein C-terminal domain-containing protein n=1 Tax=Sinanodonta woodiana TaxID=1069815 RepID=A0ABD3WZP2_SINWO